MLVRTGDTPAARARRDGAAAAAHPRHDARVALHPARRATAGARCSRTVRRSSWTRSTPSRATSAAPPRALARAARGAGRPARPAHRPLGDAEAARRGRPLPRRRRPRVRARRRRARSASSTSASRCPPSPLSAVCSHEQWEEIYARMAELVARAPDDARLRQHAQDGRAHRGAAHASCSARTRSRATTAASRSERRLDAEQRLKAGKLRALVATASLELGIDIGDVDLVIQVGATRSIATFLQRVGRAGHALARMPKGRALPADARRAGRGRGAPALRPRGRARPHAAAAAAARHPRAADRRRVRAPSPGTRSELFDALPPRVAVPRPRARGLRRGRRRSTRAGRRALLHRDGVHGRLHGDASARGSRRSLSGGAIPDTADYQVRLEPEGTLVGTRQRGLGHRVATAATSSSSATRPGGSCASSPASCAWPTRKGAAADDPVLAGRGARAARASSSAEIARAARRSAARDDAASLLASVRRRAARGRGRPDRRVRRRRASRRSARCPTQRRVILERFFDESGGMQLVVHAPFGVADQPRLGARAAQALLRRLRLRAAGGGQRGGDRALARPAAQLPARGGLRLPAPATRARGARSRRCSRRRCSRRAGAGTRSARCCSSARAAASRCRRRSCACARTTCSSTAFPQVAGLPRDAAAAARSRCRWTTRSSRQTIEDCLTEAMDVDGLPRGAARACATARSRSGRVDTAEPSAFARGILTLAALHVPRRRAARGAAHAGGASRGASLDAQHAPTSSARSIPTAIARVREEAWPQPRDAEEVHEALLWMGYVTARGGRAPGSRGSTSSRPRGRVVARRRPLVRGRGAARSEGGPARAARGARPDRRERRPARCSRARGRGRRAAHAHRRARRRGATGGCSRASTATRSTACAREIEPVTRRAVPALPRLLAARRSRAPARGPARRRRGRARSSPASRCRRRRGRRASCPRACAATGASGSTSSTLSGEVAWGRLWGAGATRRSGATPICLVPREDLDAWLALAAAARRRGAAGRGARGRSRRSRARGAMFLQELARATRLPPAVRRGGPRASSIALRPRDLRLLRRPALAPRPGVAAPTPAASPSGRWSLLRARRAAPRPSAEFVARRLLARTGVVFRKTLAREKQPRPVARRRARAAHARGARRGPRRPLRRRLRRRAVRAARGRDAAARGPAAAASEADPPPVTVSAADPLNFRGILTPDERVSPATREAVRGRLGIRKADPARGR